MPDCPFCPPAVTPLIVRSDAWCYTMWTRDTGTPAGSVMILPFAHRMTAFDLVEQEWLSTARLIRQMKEVIDEHHRPDGYNIGWNVHPTAGQTVMHAHCHLVPRYADEPLAGKGIRHWIKDPANRRGSGGR
jgi:diadenosine tetraphosphate (Ap4A) HIT family hydrolase